MACSTPFIISPAGAMPEVCRDAAYYADIDNPQSWHDAIAALDPHSQSYKMRVDLGKHRAGQFLWHSADQCSFDVICQVANRKDNER